MVILELAGGLQLLLTPGMEGMGEETYLGWAVAPGISVFSWFPAPLVLSLPTPMIFQARSKVTFLPLLLFLFPLFIHLSLLLSLIST